MALDKKALLARRLGEGDHEIEGVGTVRIRSLSRAEVLALQGLEGGTAESDRKMLAMALVDPPLTEKEAGQWQENSAPGEIEALTLAIAALSGLGGEAAKSAYKSVRS